MRSCYGFWVLWSWRQIGLGLPHTALNTCTSSIAALPPSICFFSPEVWDLRILIADMVRAILSVAKYWTSGGNSQLWCVTAPERKTSPLRPSLEHDGHLLLMLECWETRITYIARLIDTTIPQRQGRCIILAECAILGTIATLLAL